MFERKVSVFKVMVFVVFLNVGFFYGFYKLLMRFLVNKTTCLAQSNEMEW